MCLERRLASRFGEAPSGGHVPHVGGSGSFSKGGWVGEDITLTSESPESLHQPGSKNRIIDPGWCQSRRAVAAPYHLFFHGL